MARKSINTNADTQPEQTAAGTFIKTTIDAAQQPPKKQKDRRVQLLVVPDEWEKFQAFAHLAGSNPNSLINGYIHETIEQYADRIAEYEKARDAMQKALGVKPNE